MEISFAYDRQDNKPVGVTCTVDVEISNKPLIGTATCHPHDNFSRRVGRRIALTRAIKNLPREYRKRVWEKYLAKCKP